MDRRAEEKLNYPYDERTRFSLRMEFYPGADLDPAEVKFVNTLMSLRDAQIAFIKEVEAQGLGASRFLPGEVFDESGQHIARISYNGRLWAPEPLRSGGTPIAEAPSLPQEAFVWMTGTVESVLQDAYTDGPESEPEVLSLRMNEGDILIGKSRDGEARIVQEMGSEGLIDVPGGIDEIRQRKIAQDKKRDDASGPEF